MKHKLYITIFLVAIVCCFSFVGYNLFIKNTSSIEFPLQSSTYCPKTLTISIRAIGRSNAEEIKNGIKSVGYDGPISTSPSKPKIKIGALKNIKTEAEWRSYFSDPIIDEIWLSKTAYVNGDFYDGYLYLNENITEEQAINYIKVKDIENFLMPGQMVFPSGFEDIYTFDVKSPSDIDYEAALKNISDDIIKIDVIQGLCMTID